MMSYEAIEKPPQLNIKISRSGIKLETANNVIPLRLNMEIDIIKIYTQEDIDSYFQVRNTDRRNKEKYIYGISEALAIVDAQRKSFLQDRTDCKSKLDSIKKSIFFSRLFVFGFFYKGFINSKKDIENKIAVLDKIADFYYFNVEFLVHSDIREIYAQLQYNFRQAAKSEYIWEITGKEEIENPSKARTAATAKVTRKRVKFFERKLDDFESKANGMCMVSDGKNSYILYPAFLVFSSKNSLIIVPYKEIELNVNYSSFKEEDFRPKDSKIDDYTYRFVRNDGGPDGHYKDNFKIPRYKYFQIKIYIKSLKDEITFMFSNAEAGKSFANALHNYINFFK